MKNLKEYLVGAYLVALFVGIIGWVFNIIILFNSPLTPFTAKILLRIVGIFIPVIGAVMGYL